MASSKNKKPGRHREAFVSRLPCSSAPTLAPVKCSSLDGSYVFICKYLAFIGGNTMNQCFWKDGFTFQELHSLGGNSYHVKSVAAAYACALAMCSLEKFNQAMEHRLQSWGLKMLAAGHKSLTHLCPHSSGSCCRETLWSQAVLRHGSLKQGHHPRNSNQKVLIFHALEFVRKSSPRYSKIYHKTIQYTMLYDVYISISFYL